MSSVFPLYILPDVTSEAFDIFKHVPPSTALGAAISKLNRKDEFTVKQVQRFVRGHFKRCCKKAEGSPESTDSADYTWSAFVMKEIEGKFKDYVSQPLNLCLEVL